jgi:hypothetical protein
MKPYKKILICIVSALALLWVAYAAIVNSSCIAETKMRASFPGEDVEVVYLSCDTLAKQDTIDVYFLKAGANKQPSWIRWLYRKTLVFRYDPAFEDGPLPVFRASGPDWVLIAVPRVSSVLVRTEKWGDVSLDYKIGQIDYAETNKAQGER